jgi:hypothetical protein
MSSVASMMALTGSLGGGGSDPLTLTYLGSVDFQQATNPSANFSALSGGSAVPAYPFYLIGCIGAENATSGATFSISGLTLTSHIERSQNSGKGYAHIMGTTTTLTSLPTSFSVTTGGAVRSAVAWYAVTGASSNTPAASNGAVSATGSGPAHSVSVNAGDLAITVVGHENDQNLVVYHNSTDVTDARYNPNSTTAVAFGSSTRGSAGTLTAEADGPGTETGDVAIVTAVYR